MKFFDSLVASYSNRRQRRSIDAAIISLQRAEYSNESIGYVRSLYITNEKENNSNVETL